jgi:hypothetical protein
MDGYWKAVREGLAMSDKGGRIMTHHERSHVMPMYTVVFEDKVGSTAEFDVMAQDAEEAIRIARRCDPDLYDESIVLGNVLWVREIAP